MKKNVDTISKLIKQEISSYKNKVDTTNVGSVVSVGDGICTIYGLDKAMYGELLSFPNDIYGMVMNLNEDSIGAVILGKENEVFEGDQVKRTNRVVSVGVGEELLGRVVSSLGQPLDGLGPIKYVRQDPIEQGAPSIIDRESVNSPLETGIKAIDSMIPIGKGQRELIIGDRQTGKTAIAVDTIINQKGKDVICVYCAIGQKNSSVAQLVSRLKENDAMKYTIVVNASASEPSPMQYVAPYAATTMAEYFSKKGKDVLIIYDDLSKHAVAYRTLSLLLKRAPGREAFPGDIFYLHSRLLERACHLNKANGGGSLTALPIVETQAGDITSYIPTNVISITDGQIFLSSDLFNSGQRPAIDSGLSVSRVGSAAQIKAMKKIAASIKIQLANYQELLDFSRFGSDLDSSTKAILDHGAILMETLKQRQYSPLSMAEQIVDIYIAQSKLIDDIEPAKVDTLLTNIRTYIRSKEPKILDTISKTKEFPEDIKNIIDSIIGKIKEEKN